MEAKVYEVYCEPTTEPQYNENFSLLVACKREPTPEELEKLLKDRLNGYHVLWVTDDICIEITDTEIIGLELDQPERDKDCE